MYESLYVPMEEIREAERRFKQIFSVEQPFNEHLCRWTDAVLYDMYDHNQFVPNGKLTAEDLQQAADYQKAHGWDFLKIDTDEELAPELIAQFHLEADKTVTMVLPKKETEAWKQNPKVKIKDVKTADIAEDIRAIEAKSYSWIYGEDFLNRKVTRYLERVNETEGFHYFGAFLDGKIVGACYAYAKEGYVQVDDLIVDKDYRKQYVATTLLKYIAEHFQETMFLHADEDDTPREMYARMGFVTVDRVFEYNLAQERK